MAYPKHQRVFISHTEKDRYKAELLRAQLRSIKDVDVVWVKEFGLAGKNIKEIISEQINASSMVLVFVGDEGISKWQKFEIKKAKERNIPVVGFSIYSGLADEHLPLFESIDIPTINWTFEKLQRVLAGDDKSLSYEVPEPNKFESPIIQIDFEKLSLELTNYLAENPDELYRLSPRKFEELIAYLMEKHGYEVTLTQQSKDGGVDIFALHKDEFGSFLTLVECKKYARDRPVGVGVVRSMYGVLNVENASHGVIATTSTFTTGAKKMARQYQYQLSLKDHADILTWMKTDKNLT